MLFYHFLRERLETMNEAHRLSSASAAGEPFVPASYVAAMAHYEWPGAQRARARQRRAPVRCRELRSGARARHRRPAGAAASAARERGACAHAARAGRSDRRRADDAELWRPCSSRASGSTAPRADSGVSKTYLYKRLEAGGLVPVADRLPVAEIRSALDASAGDFDAASERLRVSPRALKLQLKRLKTP